MEWSSFDTISDEAIGNILRRHNIPPAPDRGGSPSWRHLMTHYKDQILACDFFTVETLFLKTVYVFFFICMMTYTFLPLIVNRDG